ncbi:MAG: site-specific integrase [Candidatus Sphingomonas colombiensis]|nr:site-specific integrase [Sphingomonas sp.]WEK43612.1 MAG: site-specific integrase [Sphingomonas sp.]
MTKWAPQLAPHVFVHPGELHHARWDEIDLDTRSWAIPAEKMKMRKAHRVPLLRQSILILQEVRSIAGRSGYVFPSMRSRTRPMSENTLNGALRRLGYASDEMTAHGFRAMAQWRSDLLDDLRSGGAVLPFSGDEGWLSNWASFELPFRPVAFSRRCAGIEPFADWRLVAV